jgi:drug/metabolite transporter (DMT)-like permease
MRGVELIGANRAGLYVYLVPVFAAFMAIGLLSEHMHDYHVVALLMVLAGIALAEKHKVSAPAG